MHEHPRNPPSNVLAAGVTEDALIKAIERCGYPLQAVAVDRIVATLGREDTYCTVQEEYSFVDKDSGQVRQLDAFVSGALAFSTRYTDPGPPTDPADYLRFNLDFLIECKHSELPFVFFARHAFAGHFPRLAGLPHPSIDMKMLLDDEFWLDMSVADVLGVIDLPFAKHDLTAVSMTRVLRKGSALEISGEEAYRHTALPLLKAYENHLVQATPKSSHLYFDVRFVIPLVVLNAPIVVAKMENETPDLEVAPWVRVVRSEPGDDPGLRVPDVRTFDVVHVDYLESYVEQALSAGRELSERCRTIPVQLITGQALLPGDPVEGVQPDENLPDDEPPVYSQVSPTMSPKEFQDWVSKRWISVHSGQADEAD